MDYDKIGKVIICPYCDYEHSDPHQEYIEDKQDEKIFEEFECWNCSNMFSVETRLSWTYYSYQRTERADQK